MAMTNARRLGRIVLRDRPTEQPPLSDLGHDPLHGLPPVATLHARLRARSTPVKTVLLDQSLFAGVGNWIADEVLYQVAIDPRRRTDSLSEAEVRQMRTALHRIVQRAVAVQADSRRFPRTWLFHHRWGRNKGAMTARGERIEFLEIGGRTTAWVPTRLGKKKRRTPTSAG